LETTGLYAKHDSILEIGAIMVNENLEAIPGLANFHTVVRWKGDPSGLPPVVQKMHTNNGLFDECCASKVIAPQAILDFALWCEESSVDDPGKVYFAGNNIKFDLGFLEEYGFIAPLDIHYRSVDISSIKVLTNTWLREEFIAKLNKPESKALHRSIPDCYDSIAELAWYKELLWDY
jgi:oligoribonuclease